MKLTRNFSKREFESKDGTIMNLGVLAQVKLVAQNLQVLRDYLDEPIHINSGFRSPQHNRHIGGVKSSYHIKGMAADIVVKSKTPKSLVKIIEKLIRLGKMSEGGIGLYNGFVHYDIRGTKARWDNSPWYNFF